MERKIFVNQFKNLFFYFITAIVFSFLATYVYSQDTLEKTVIFFLFTALLLTIMFCSLSPKSVDFYATISENNLFLKLWFLEVFILAFVPLLVMVIVTGSFINLVLFPYLSWILLPLIVFLAANYLTLIEKVGSNNKVIPHRAIFFLVVIATVLMAVGFDTRFTASLWDGFNDVSYFLNAIFLSTLLIALYLPIYYSKGLNKEKMRVFNPSRDSLKVSAFIFSILSLIILPSGLITGFLSWNPQLEDPLLIIISFIGIFVTIAIPEEFIARAILLNEADFLVRNQKAYYQWLTLILVSFVFGLSHWNNDVFPYVVYYIVFATIAGIGYGLTWRKKGLFSAALTHTLVDWVWALFFKR